MTVTFTDHFCGAGGGSQGISRVPGTQIDYAINHWQKAIDSHQANFPNTKHDCADLQAVDPRRYGSTRAALFAPECRRHSKASGSRRNDRRQLKFHWDGGPDDPAHIRSRATMNEVVRFTEFHKYDLVIVENVYEVTKWDEFDAWWREMTELLGYTGSVLSLNSMFFKPAPQSRDRVFFVFTRKGIKPPDLSFMPSAFCNRCDKDVNAIQSWKPKSSLLRIGKYKEQYIFCCPCCGLEVLPYYYCAANVIDWSLPLQPVFGRHKPMKELEPKTIARIQRGLDKQAYLPVAHGKAAPFLIDTCFGDGPGGSQRNAVSLAQPYPTATTRQSVGLVVPQPAIVEYYSTGSLRPITEPLSTVTASGNHHGLLVPPSHRAFISSYYGNDTGHKLSDPIPTVVTVDKHALVVAAQSESDIPQVRLEDCQFRMLEPEEIARAMSFEPGYIVYGNKKERVKQYGHAIVPPVMTWIVERCMEVLA